MEQTESPATNQQPPSLLDYLHVIAKHRRMILVVTLTAAILSVIYAFTLPNIYTAKTMILPSQEDKSMMSAMMAQLGGVAAIAGGGTGFMFGGPTTTELYVSMLKSEAVKDPVIDRFKLVEVYKRKYRTDVYKLLDRMVNVSAGKKDGIITIQVDGKDPKRAADMANAYVEELGNLAIRLNVTGAGKNRTFLEERLNKARGDLAKAEDDLRTFQAKNRAVQITTQAEATIKGLADMKAQLAAQEVQLATLRRRFTESSQEVKTLSTSVDNLRSQIAKLEGRGGNSAIPSVGSVPALQQEYMRLMRDFKIQESLVELLTKQYEIASLSEAKDISPFQVILKARVPERKSKPSKKKVVMSITLSVFVISLISAFLKENYERMSESERMRWRKIYCGLSLRVKNKC